MTRYFLRARVTNVVRSVHKSLLRQPLVYQDSSFKVSPQLFMSTPALVLVIPPRPQVPGMDTPFSSRRP